MPIPHHDTARFSLLTLAPVYSSPGFRACTCVHVRSTPGFQALLKIVRHGRRPLSELFCSEMEWQRDVTQASRCNLSVQSGFILNVVFIKNTWEFDTAGRQLPKINQKKPNKEQNTGKGAHVGFGDTHQLRDRGHRNGPRDHMTETKLTREPRNENYTATWSIWHRWTEQPWSPPG